MIYAFFGGFALGALWALVVAAVILKRRGHTDDRQTVEKPGKGRLNDDKEKQARERDMAEKQRQFEMLMTYKGESQKG